MADNSPFFNAKSITKSAGLSIKTIGLFTRHDQQKS